MPKRIEGARIALIDSPLEVEKTETKAEIYIRDPGVIKSFLDQETEMLKKMVEKIKDSGTNVLFAQKGIDDVAQHFLAKAGIMAAKSVKKSDIEKLVKACGAKIVSNFSDLKESDLGSCELVEERKVGDDEMIFVEGCKNPKAVAIFIRAGLERMIDEAERALNDALHVISDINELPQMVPGGGSIEMELSKTVRKYARKVGGREQLAIEAFGDALEVVPRTLAENAGLDILDTMVEMKTSHEKKGGLGIGVNVFKGGVIDMFEEGVVEPMVVKQQAIKSAVEVASMILRIDDVIAAVSPEKGPGESGEMPDYEGD